MEPHERKLQTLTGCQHFDLIKSVSLPERLFYPDKPQKAGKQKVRATKQTFSGKNNSNNYTF